MGEPSELGQTPKKAFAFSGLYVAMYIAIPESDFGCVTFDESMNCG